VRADIFDLEDLADPLETEPLVKRDDVLASIAPQHPCIGLGERQARHGDLDEAAAEAVSLIILGDGHPSELVPRLVVDLRATAPDIRHDATDLIFRVDDREVVGIVEFIFIVDAESTGLPVAQDVGPKRPDAIGWDFSNLEAFGHGSRGV
jgi:hypothetical protein